MLVKTIQHASTMHSKDDLIALAKAIGAAHGLIPEIICAQIERESSWQTWSIRYEDGFFSRYIAPLLTKKEENSAVLSSTEARARAFS